MPLEGVVPWLLSPFLKALGKGEHFIPNLCAVAHASKGCIPLGHIVITLKHIRARGLWPLGITCLCKLHLWQFTCHCHILCEQLEILPIPRGDCNHFLPPHQGILYLFYPLIHPPSMLQYWIRSSLCHCCSQVWGPPMGLSWVSWQIWLQSLGLGSCSELERSICQPPPPLSAAWSTSLGSSSRNWASQLSRQGDWLSALAIGSCTLLWNLWGPWLLPWPWSDMCSFFEPVLL